MSVLSNHTLRPIRSFLSFLGFETRPSSPLRPSSSSSETNSNAGCYSTPQYEPQRPTSAPPQIQINRLAPAHASPQSGLSPSAIPQFEDEHHRVPHESDNKRSSIHLPHHQPRDVHHLALPHPQAEQLPPPGSLLEQPPSNEGQLCSQSVGQGLFYQASNFVIKGSTFVDNSSVFVNNSTDDFMASFLEETIRGAEFDSSDPNMPLRCHHGTRAEIIKRCQKFILNRERRLKVRWVVGAAGVGKSAIMQSVAWDKDKILKDIIVGATIFFSINGRQDGTKTINTIAYQLAVKLKHYRRFVQHEIAHNPSLLRKSLSTQFEKFIIEPFIHHCIIDPSSRLLIIIDGLDECANPLTQRELLGLISDFCTTYTTSPIVWMIASRPEPHISSFFYQPELALPYEKEEIWIDSNDAHEDVKLYLRDKFKEIQMASITLRRLPQWPSEDDFSKIARASGGLFAYASTVVRYISDPTHGDPVGQLHDVLEIIETGTNADAFGEDHPMARLDALYARILSRIPTKVMANTRKLLLTHDQFPSDTSFLYQCNFLGMTEHAAYGAAHYIHSISSVPAPDEAANKNMSILHKSFYDYLGDYKRSQFSPNHVSESDQLLVECALRILEQAPDGLYMDGARGDDLQVAGELRENGLWTGDNISISWPAVGEDSNRKLRFEMFVKAANIALYSLYRNQEACDSPLILRLLTTGFTRVEYGRTFVGGDIPVFNESRRRKLLDDGILKQVPLETLCYDDKSGSKCLAFRLEEPARRTHSPWNTCTHGGTGYSRLDNSGMWSWSLSIGESCDHCFRRFTRHCETRPPGYLVTVFNVNLTSCVAEFQFVDPEDGGSEWTYHFFAKYKVGDDESERGGDK